MKRRSHHPLWWLTAFLVLAAVAAPFCGAVRVAPSEFFTQLTAGDWSGTAFRIVAAHRLPRVLLSMAAGAALALAGLAAQTLFRNPLASPYVIGISSGAAAGAVGAMLLPWWWSRGGAVGGGLLGGVAALLLLRALARGDGGSGYGARLLLIGVALNAFFSALVSGALFLAQERLQGVVFWMLGGFWRADWPAALGIALTAAAGWLLLRRQAAALDVLWLGDAGALSSGVRVGAVQTWLLLLTAGLTAPVVSCCGIIGFVGLIVPHLMRRVLGAGHRALVPGCALAGALLMLAADTAARCLLAPAEIPVGILTALFGAPIFLQMIRRRETT